MRIRQLTAANFKGQTFTEALAAVTLWTGQNSKGKSSRAEALAAAVLGYVPGYSKKPSDVHGLFASGATMAAGYITDAGGAVSRKWESRGGSVKYTGPEESELPAVALDPQEAFFKLSGPERAKFLFAASGAAKRLDAKALERTVTANLKNVKLDENTEQTEAAVAELVEWVLARKPAEPQEWLEGLVADAKEKFKAAKQNCDRLDKTSQGNAQAADAGDPAPQDAEARLAAARDELAKAEAVATRLETELNAARRAYNEAKAIADGAVDETAARAELARLEGEAARLAAATATEVSDREELSAWHVAANADAVANAKQAAACRELDRVKGELAHAESEKTCPTCGQSTEAIKKAIVKALKEEVVGLQAAAQAATEKWGEAKAEQERLNALYRAANDKVRQHQDDSKEYKRVVMLKEAVAAKLAANAKSAEAAAKLPAMLAEGVDLKQRHADQQAVVADKREAVSAWSVAANRLTAERAESAQRARVSEEQAKARAFKAVCKEFVDMLATLQAELTEKAVGPIVARMNELCGPVLPHKVEFRDGELAFGGWSHKTASDSEKLLVYAALSVALAADSPVKLCVVGRLESFDGVKKAALAKLLVDLVAAGKIDQAVLVEVDAGGIGPRWWAQAESEDFKVVQL